LSINLNSKEINYSSRLERRRSGKVACAVLAAGSSSRFGSSKQLAKIVPKGKSLIQNAVDIANETKSDYVFVVLGHDFTRIMEELRPGRAQILLNKHYKEGLSTSIRTAISNLPDDCSFVVLMVADQPYLTPRLVNRLVESLKQNPQAEIAALAHQHEPRNPAIFSRRMFSRLKQIKGDRGAREILSSNAGKENIILINVRDPWVIFDIDTTSALKRSSKE
jgi:molybdenum cofactor cytidylyltransferase